MEPARRYLLLTVVPMAALITTAAIWAMLLLPSMPDPMATDFDGDSRADGFVSPVITIVLFTGMSLLALIGFVVFARLGLWHGSAGRILAGSSGATVTLLSVLLIELFRVQADLTDATEARQPVGVLWLYFAIAVGVGLVLAWLATPVPRKPQGAARASAHSSLPRDRSIWTGTVIMHIGIRAVLALVTVFTIIFAFVMPNWATLITAVVMIAAVWATWGWRIRIDAAGLRYRSFAGIPRAHLSHQEIAEAELIDINLGDWGGWGWRKNASGTALVTQSGPGIRITRTNGRILEISTDDAATAVQLLERYRQPMTPGSTPDGNA